VIHRSDSSLTLIVDNDLGFLMWLGDIFAHLGCQAFPALHCRQALAIARKLEEPISTLVVNPELAGASRMVKTMLASNPGARVILIRNAKTLATNRIGFPAHTTLERPSAWEPISRSIWIGKIRRILPQERHN
jgi:ActR/RegA family two-component response regulator